jgi:hypothetical protein
VSLTLHVERPNSLLPTVSYTIYNDSDVIHISTAFDLRQLGATDQPQMYAMNFPVSVAGADVFVEALGGFMDGLTRPASRYEHHRLLYAGSPDGDRWPIVHGFGIARQPCDVFETRLKPMCLRPSRPTS